MMFYSSIWLKDPPENRAFLLQKYVTEEIDIEDILGWLADGGKIWTKWPIRHDKAPIFVKAFSKHYIDGDYNYWNITYRDTHTDNPYNINGIPMYWFVDPFPNSIKVVRKME
jgi:hypothetical protein